MKEVECTSCSAHLLLNEQENESETLPGVIHLKKSVVVLGRQSAKVDIPISSKKYPCMTSRVHARLEQEETEDNSTRPYSWFLRDMKSLNGVLVNNIVISTKKLHDEDIIMLGGKKDQQIGDKIEKPNTDIIYTFKYNPKYSFLAKRMRSSQYSEDSPTSKRRAVEIDGENDESQDQVIKEKDEQLSKKEQELKEKEESFKKVQDSFHQQIATFQTELQSKAAENEKLKEIVANNVAKQEKNPSFEDDVTCVVCFELFVEPFTLSCSHTYCADCLEKCMRVQKQCPFCRFPITSMPIYARTIHNVIQKLLQGLSEEKQKEYQTRVKVYQDTMTAKLMTLSGLIQRAKQSNARFLDIKQRWKENEREIFITGVSTYTGKARVLYCSTTGLTPQFIASSGVAVLKIALANVGISYNPNSTKLYSSEREYLQSQLTQFIERRFPL